ncbi:unnamed protein product [Caenorhabditis sp. 36 PRJEB53466]|nr:unnamed protein product [Caenorhabditis sp. 36 PRJEB53466]
MRVTYAVKDAILFCFLLKAIPLNVDRSPGFLRIFRNFSKNLRLLRQKVRDLLQFLFSTYASPKRDNKGRKARG